MFTTTWFVNISRDGDSTNSQTHAISLKSHRKSFQLYSQPFFMFSLADSQCIRSLLFLSKPEQCARQHNPSGMFPALAGAAEPPPGPGGCLWLELSGRLSGTVLWDPSRLREGRAEPLQPCSAWRCGEPACSSASSPLPTSPASKTGKSGRNQHLPRKVKELWYVPCGKPCGAWGDAVGSSVWGFNSALMKLSNKQLKP